MSPRGEADRTTTSPSSTDVDASGFISGVDSGVRTRRVLGFDLVDAASVDTVIEALLGPQPDDGRLGLLATPNTDDIVRLERPENHELARFLTRARYLLPDGQPVVWASRLLGSPLTSRLTGADLMAPLWGALRHHHIPTVVVAPRAAIGAALAEPDDRLRVLVPGRFDSENLASYDDFTAELADTCERIGARHAIIGIGFPHQQRLALKLDGLLGPAMPMTSLLGGALEFLTGATTRAPNWMRTHGLEWAHRLAHDPRRLARRYLIDDPAFVAIVARQYTAARRHHGSVRGTAPEVHRCP